MAEVTLEQQKHLTVQGWYELDGKYNLEKLPEGLWATCRFDGLSLLDAITIQECIDKLQKEKSK